MPQNANAPTYFAVANALAAFAQRHQVVEKEVNKGRTRSRVAEVSGEVRVHELARLMSGHVTEAALQHAQELLDKAQEGQGKKRKAG